MEYGHRNIVLDGRVAVQDHTDVIVKRRAALRHYHDALLTCRLNNHLPLLAAGLVVAFDRERTVCSRPTDSGAGIVEGVNHRFEVAIGSVKDGTRREHARPDHLSGLDQFRLRKYHFGIGRGVMHSGYAIGEVSVVGPVLLGR